MVGRVEIMVGTSHRLTVRLGFAAAASHMHFISHANAGPRVFKVVVLLLLCSHIQVRTSHANGCAGV
jgi:hypothetical protein